MTAYIEIWNRNDRLAEDAIFGTHLKPCSRRAVLAGRDDREETNAIVIIPEVGRVSNGPKGMSYRLLDGVVGRTEQGEEIDAKDTIDTEGQILLFESPDHEIQAAAVWFKDGTGGWPFEGKDFWSNGAQQQEAA